jgi:CHRD domain
MKKLAMLSCLVLVGLVVGAGPAVAGGGHAHARKSPTKTFVVVMTAAQEVPLCAPADRSDHGVAIFHVLNEATGTVGYALIATDLPGDLSAAHIHIAPKGVPGPVEQPLALRPGVQKGLIGLGSFDNPALLDALRANPSDYYVNVHTSAETGGCPSGVIRGQFH